MKTRVAIGFLWTYLAWYGWSMYAGLAGLNVLWGPLVALAAVAFVAFLHVARDVKATELVEQPERSPMSASPEAAA